MEIRDKKIIKPEIFAPFVKVRANQQIMIVPTVSQEDKIDIKPKKSKKGLIATIIGLAGGSVLVTSLVIGFLLHRKSDSLKRFTGVTKFFQDKKVEIIRKLKDKPNSAILKAKSIGIGALLFIWNIGTLKDVLFREILVNSKNPLGKVGEKFVNGINKVFKWITISAARKKYVGVEKRLQRVEESLAALVKEKPALRQNMESLRKQIAGLRTDFENKRANKLCTDIEEHMETFMKNVRGSIFTSNKERFFDRLKDYARQLYKTVTKPMAKDHVEEIMKKHKDLLDSEKGSIENLLEKIKKLIPENDSSLNEIEKLRKALASATEFELDKFGGRMRDIYLGSGAFDSVAPVVAAGMFAKQLHDSDSKEERISKTIKDGMPIAGGLAAWAFSTVYKCMNGLDAVLVALGTHFLLSPIFKFIDNRFYSKGKEWNAAEALSDPETNNLKVYKS